MNKTMNLHFQPFLKTIFYVTACAAIIASVQGCSDNDPKKEDTPEMITSVTLTFTPTDGSAAVRVDATDPDGDGVKPIAANGPINLAANKTYTMAIDMLNTLAQPTDAGYKVSDEVAEEGIEHMFFFSWTNNLFSNPSGNGNIDNRNDPVLYEGGAYAVDKNGRPLGLITTWTTAASTGSALTGNFRVLLKHQPDLKSDTSDSTTGETDLDVTFVLNVQ
jgi:hypothetical protein